MNADIQPTLAQIVIYPIKSLDGLIVTRSKISVGGALEFDRRWAIVDESGTVVNAKRTAKIQQLRSQFNFTEDRSTIALQIRDENTSYTFCLTTELTQLARWLSEFFGFPVQLIENAAVGFPDDLDAYGPTIVSTATLEKICEWFPGLDLAEVRRRFRTNLELDGVPAFWEDRLFGAPGETIDFQLGDVQFHGINPCQRCIVPTRNSVTGDVSPKFQQIFTHQRQQTLPAGVNRSRFNHFYRLAVNTRIPLAESGKFLKTGDALGI
ncbi:MOSC N-terminal beta barrel domain-containing protein [Chamaesiphon sp. OTE_20_metabat_361]|uniref:MOSC domain-containing protein n=1 Tax=Chamaesiphon sp. OTE_20_metabat_361 TaxID=2964689 RepID=UPI002869EF03|nr:MOSC N-terminal beta barrel domain-containing protein [Chamaesiphon sp. OTE_20_metabat_361]